MRKSVLRWLVPIFLSIFCYLLFFHPTLKPETMIWGQDLQYFYYPVRFYLFEILKSGSFPFWTERIFSGFPIYADVEMSYLNPVNLLSTYLLGPVFSYKLMHFSYYFFSSLCMFLFLSRKKIGIIGFFVANLTYFFTFFALNHQDHSNMLFIFYLLPMNVLLADLFIERRKFTFIVAGSILMAFTFYVGSIQTALMSFMAWSIYLTAHLKREIDLKAYLAYLILVPIFAITLALPVVIPATKLLVTTERANSEFTFREGSLLPPMIITSLYPHMFNSGDSYYGAEIGEDYSKLETYNYLGIVAIILTLSSILFLPSSRLKYFGVALILVFFILGFIRMTPILSTLKVPVISMFRYWMRSSILASLGVALLSAQFIQIIIDKKEKFIPTNLIYITASLFYFVVLTIVNWDHKEVQRIFRFFRKGMFVIDDGFYFWIFLILFTVALICLALKSQNRLHRLLMVVLIGILTLGDFYYFGKGILDFKDFTNPQKVIMPAEYSNTRLVRRDERIYGNESLYYKNWWLFGYSQLKDDKYTNYVKDLGFHYIKRPSDISKSMHEGLRSAGVVAIVEKNASPTTLVVKPSNILELFSPPLAGEYFLKKEGRISASVSSQESKEVIGLIRNYEGWDILVDGMKVPITSSPSDIYVKFWLEKGSHTVDLIYTPKDLVLALKLSLFLLAIEGFVVFVLKNRILPK